MRALREQIYGGFGDINFYAVDYARDLRETACVQRKFIIFYFAELFVLEI